MRIRSQEAGPRLPFMITMTLVLLAFVSELFSQGCALLSTCVSP